MRELKISEIPGAACGWRACDEKFTPWNKLPDGWRILLVIDRQSEPTARVGFFRVELKGVSHDKTLCPKHVAALDALLFPLSSGQAEVMRLVP